jgi:hypothetical protein
MWGSYNIGRFIQLINKLIIYNSVNRYAFIKPKKETTDAMHFLQFRSIARRRNLIIQQRGQKVCVILASDLRGEIPGSKLEFVSLGRLL